MIYLSQILGKPVVDSTGTEIGKINDLAISTGEVFPRITSFAFKGPSKTPFMVSWRKYVEDFDDETILLNTESHNIRFSYLQPDEVLLARDLLNKQIVDTQGMKVVRVNDLKLSSSNTQLRLLGAEVGARGILRGLSRHLENAVVSVAKTFHKPLEEKIIAWNYMELLDRDLSQVKLSVTHKRLHELHPADVADILEQLDPQQRGRVFEHLDNQQAAEAMSELEDEYQTDIIDDLSESRASELLAQMEPDDAADILGGLPYEKAEKLLWLMGVQDERRIRSLLGYREKTAGGIMTTQFVAIAESETASTLVEKLRSLGEDCGFAHYLYTVDANNRLSGVLSLRELVLADGAALVGELVTRDLITASAEDDQEEVAEYISKYDLLALPVVDEGGALLGIVTIDDALDVLEEEHDEDLQIAGAGARSGGEANRIGDLFKWLLRKELWFIVWAVVAFILASANGLPFFAGVLILMPFILLVADDLTAFAVNDLIEYDGGSEDGPSLLKLFTRDLVAGLVVSAIAAGIFIAFTSVASDTSGIASSGVASSDLSILDITISLIGGAIFPTAIACFAVFAVSILVTLFARRRLDKGKTFSNTPLAFAVMVFGIVIQLGVLCIESVLFAS